VAEGSAAEADLVVVAAVAGLVVLAGEAPAAAVPTEAGNDLVFQGWLP